MAINPMMLMKLRGELENFNVRHPKLQMFLRDASARTQEGDVLEVSLTKPDGSKMRTNIRITSEDKALFESLLSMGEIKN